MVANKKLEYIICRKRRYLKYHLSQSEWESIVDRNSHHIPVYVHATFISYAKLILYKWNIKNILYKKQGFVLFLIWVLKTITPLC